MNTQFDLFGPTEAAAGIPDDEKRLPEGLRLRRDLISPAEQDALVEKIAALPFRAFGFKGYFGKRRTVSFGWKYDFGAEKLHRTDDMPPFLLDLREAAAAFAELPPESLQQVLVTEYAPGAGIGWHRDKAVFAEVIGISLLSACTFRLRRRTGEKWQRASFLAEPGSAYLLSGPSRSEWEHSIAPVEHLRYSVTYRNVR